MRIKGYGTEFTFRESFNYPQGKVKSACFLVIAKFFVGNKENIRDLAEDEVRTYVVKY